MNKPMRTILLAIISLLVSFPSFSQECHKLLYIIDGDTIKILYHGRKTSVRLLGIDTPESRRNRRAYYQARRNHQDVKTIIHLGKKAKKHLKELLVVSRILCKPLRVPPGEHFLKFFLGLKKSIHYPVRPPIINHCNP